MLKKSVAVMMAWICVCGLMTGCQSDKAAAKQVGEEGSAAVETEITGQKVADAAGAETVASEDSQPAETVASEDSQPAETVASEDSQPAEAGVSAEGAETAMTGAESIETQALSEEELEALTGTEGMTEEELKELVRNGGMTQEELAELAAEGETVEEYIDILVSDINVSYTTDFVHAGKDSIILGEAEGFTMTVTINRENAGPEDLFVGFDDTKITIDIIDYESENGKSVITLYGMCNEVGDTDMIVTTCYEIEKNGEEARCFSFYIKQLDDVEGRAVYINTAGDKYHYSPQCAGDDAVITTVYDSELMGIEPCEKCTE